MMDLLEIAERLRSSVNDPDGLNPFCWQNNAADALEYNHEYLGRLERAFEKVMGGCRPALDYIGLVETTDPQTEDKQNDPNLF